MDAIAYIDGFNLYYGALKGSPFRWFDIEAFARALTPAKYQLVKVRYFTARVKPRPANPSAHTDQQAYLKAITAFCPLLKVHYGHYSEHRVRMYHANPPPTTVEVIKTEEKGSDVNLAVHLLNDAYTQGNRAAVVITNDSDIAEAMALTKQAGLEICWFPPVTKPRYPSNVLQKVIPHRKIRLSTYQKCLLPDPVPRHLAQGIRKPKGW